MLHMCNPRMSNSVHSDMRGLILPRTVSVFAFLGAALLLTGTLIHPAHADPNIPSEAFTEYAADPSWVFGHLTQLAGALLLFIALFVFTQLFTSNWATLLGRIGAFLAIVSASVAATLQAVDGIALKPLALAWVNAAESQRASFFAATLAVRHIEIGLASIFAIVSGATILFVAGAVLADPKFRWWLGALGILGGLPTLLGGIVMAYTGFSETAMLINMPANLVLLAWACAIGLATMRSNAPIALVRDPEQ